ncbi:MAG: type II toxin-antitoxin system VapC family toxin [Thaumarchaeota archaeon]|nr:type II toxin-antitoxin system VapC family toxin [Nitrososphaerota archaeon]
MICVDSYGWIERITNGPKAARYNEIIDAAAAREIVTATIVIYEVYRRVKQAAGEETALEAVAALSETNIVAVEQTIALEAADYSIELGLHMSDAFVYATARHFDAELYTSDEDLRKLKHVTFI